MSCYRILSISLCSNNICQSFWHLNEWERAGTHILCLLEDKAFFETRNWSNLCKAWVSSSCCLGNFKRYFYSRKWLSTYLCDNSYCMNLMQWQHAYATLSYPHMWPSCLLSEAMCDRVIKDSIIIHMHSGAKLKLLWQQHTFCSSLTSEFLILSSDFYCVFPYTVFCMLQECFVACQVLGSDRRGFGAPGSCRHSRRTGWLPCSCPRSNPRFCSPFPSLVHLSKTWLNQWAWWWWADGWTWWL